LLPPECLRSPKKLAEKTIFRNTHYGLPEQIKVAALCDTANDPGNVENGSMASFSVPRPDVGLTHDSDRKKRERVHPATGLKL
jgi:hypothetical protein